jgi:hypothetical protein
VINIFIRHQKVQEEHLEIFPSGWLYPGAIQVDENELNMVMTDIAESFTSKSSKVPDSTPFYSESGTNDITFGPISAIAYIRL